MASTLSTSTSIYLSASAQTQLKTMKAANEISLNRLNTRKSEVTSKNNTLNTLQASIDNVQKDLVTLSSATDLDAQKTALTKFASDYTALITKFSSLTGKDGALNDAGELRSVRSALRTPFGDFNLYDEFAAAGLKASSTGLEASNSAVTTALTSDQLTQLSDSFNAALTKLENATNSYETNLTAKTTKLVKDIAREQARVDSKNTRTEKNFLKMYQAMQAYSSASSTSGNSSILSGLA